PIPRGKGFDGRTNLEEIVRYSNNLTYPLVVKPTDGSSGRGVITNIENQDALKEAVQFVRTTLGHENILVQEHVQGKEVRIYVLNKRVIAATNRMPANVIGDGRSTILKLIEKKNEARKQVPHLYSRPIKVDGEIRRKITEANYTLDTVLRK